MNIGRVWSYYVPLITFENIWMFIKSLGRSWDLPGKSHHVQRKLQLTASLWNHGQGSPLLLAQRVIARARNWQRRQNQLDINESGYSFGYTRGLVRVTLIASLPLVQTICVSSIFQPALRVSFREFSYPCLSFFGVSNPPPILGILMTLRAILRSKESKA